MAIEAEDLFQLLKPLPNVFQIFLSVIKNRLQPTTKLLFTNIAVLFLRDCDAFVIMYAFVSSIFSRLPSEKQLI
jgi:hypothetical protein